MIKTFEPFQSKIQLHIETGFLQRLWDRYVPVSSDSYDRISLIYLKGNHVSGEEPGKQIQLFVNIILKNTLMQMNLRENQMLLTRNTVNQSLEFTTKLYFQQLKRIDRNIYHSLKRHIAYMEGKAGEDRRYRSWQRENQAVEGMMREYQILSDFSKRLTEFKTVQSVEIEKRYVKELINLLQKEKRFRHFVKNADKEDPHDLWERLPDILAETGQAQEGLKKEKQTILQKLIRRFRYHIYRKLNASLKQIQEDYMEETRICLKEHVFQTGDPEEYRVITSIVSVGAVLEKLNENVLSESKVLMEDIKKLEKETRKTLTRQKQKIIKTEIKIFEKYQDIFRSERYKNVFRFLENNENRIHISKQKFEKLWKWSEALFILREQALQTAKEEAELKHLTGQLIEYLERKVSFEDIRMSRLFEYGEERVDDSSIQELVEYIHQIENEEEYKEFVRRLADTVVTGYGVELEDLSAEMHRYSRSDSEETVRESAAKLWEWSEALLIHPKQEAHEESPDVAFVEETEEHLHRYGEDVQTRRQQDMTDLKYLTAHLLRNIEKEISFTDSESVQVSSLQRQLMEDIKTGRFLVYREEQLYHSSVQEMLEYIRQIEDEEVYERFVEKLADTAVARYSEEQKDISVKTALETQIYSLPDESPPVRTGKNDGVPFGYTLLDGRPPARTGKNDGMLFWHDRKSSEGFSAKLWEWSQVLLIHARQETEQDTDREGLNALRQLTDMVIAQYKLNQEDKSENTEGSRIPVYGEEQLYESSVQEIYRKEQLHDLSIQEIYRKEQLHDPSIQEMLEYIRQIDDEKEYREFIRELADTIAIRYRMEQGELHGEVKEYGEEYDTKLYGWGKALLRHPRQRSDGSRPELGRQAGSLEKQTREIARQQTEENIKQQTEERAKKQIGELRIQDLEDITALKNLTASLTDYMEKEESFTEMRRFLVYREEQLRDPSIQELLRHVRQINDGTEYQKLVARLADTIITGYRTEQKRAFETFVGIQERNSERTDSQKIFDSYPRLVYEIQRYERQQRRDLEPENGRIEMLSDQLKNVYSEDRIGARETASQFEGGIHYSNAVRQDIQKLHSYAVQQDIQKLHSYVVQQDIEKLHSNAVQQDVQKLYSNAMLQDIRKLHNYQMFPEYASLKHALPEKGSKDSRRTDGMRIQNETMQIKSVQKQLDVRLGEVEQKLSEVESREKAQASVRDIAEKVKRQLHEELHIERMRRGMS